MCSAARNAGRCTAVGDNYQGCYVLAVSTIDETSAELTLLSPNEQAATTTGKLTFGHKKSADLTFLILYPLAFRDTNSMRD